MRVTNLLYRYGLDDVHVRYKNMSHYGFYEFDENIIYISKHHRESINWNNLEESKEFYMTLLHDIKHAIDRRNLGLDKFLEWYQMSGEESIQNGMDFYRGNDWEIEAEKFAKTEFEKLINEGYLK